MSTPLRDRTDLARSGTSDSSAPPGRTGAPVVDRSAATGSVAPCRPSTTAAVRGLAAGARA